MNTKYRKWNSKLIGIPEGENKHGSRTFTNYYLGKNYLFRINENWIMTQNCQYIF